MDDEPEIEKHLKSSKPTDFVLENCNVKEEAKNEGLSLERSHDSRRG